MQSRARASFEIRFKLLKLFSEDDVEHPFPGPFVPHPGLREMRYGLFQMRFVRTIEGRLFEREFT